MKEDLKLGQIIKEPSRKDAIHMAIAPLKVAHITTAGRHVGIDSEGRASEYVDPKVGIIDPFLTRTAEAGDACWIFIYPNTITGLRHEWSHPSFSEKGRPVASASEKWLRDFADLVDADYDEMMEIAATHCDPSDKWGGDYLIQGGKWEGQGTPDDFWTHFAAVTGKTGEGGIFS